jgi:hypothetical protein
MNNPKEPVMKKCMSFLAVVALVLSGCGKEGDKVGKKDGDKDSKGAATTGGHAQPEEALKAYAKALRESNATEYKSLFGENPGRVSAMEEMMKQEAHAAGGKGPEAVAKAWQQGLKEMAENEWTEGKYKIFPTEMKGEDQASILCVYETPSRIQYRRYEFKKVGGKWYQTTFLVVDEKDVDANKYKWERK